MVKCIFMITLLVFMPLFAHVEAKAEDTTQHEVITLGRDINEKNIPLDIGKLQDSLKEAFLLSYNEEIESGVFAYIMNNYNTPYSMKELFDACDKGIEISVEGKSAKCGDFLKRYMEKIVKRRKFLPVYRLY